MKSIITVAILIFFLMGSISCKKFLIRNPETFISDGNFYKTESDFEQSVTGIYSPLLPLYNNDWVITEFHSGNTFFVFDAAQRGPKPEEDLATFTVESNNRNIATNWTQNYLIIARANAVLNKIKEFEFKDQSKKDNLIGQALFLKSLAYVNLVYNFGPVPLFEGPVDNYDGAFQKRTDVLTIYNKVIDDLKSAISLLPKGAKSAPFGRVTAGAASTLLADVYLTLGMYDDVISALEPVLAQGYALMPDYRDIFDPTKKDNNEIIFQVNFVEGGSHPMSSNFPYLFLPDVDDPAIFTGLNNESRNTHASFNVPTPDLLDSYEDKVNDQRFSKSIAFYTGSSPIPGVTYDNFPYIYKFQFPHSLPGETDQNWVLFRYAEVYLMLAEAYNETNKPGDALTDINKVRERAGVNDINIMDKELLRNAIFHERQIEFAFENKRWHDLVRSGKAIQTINQFGLNVISNPQKYYYPLGDKPPANSFNINENELVYPIPVTEIEINPQLTQNPGY